MRSWLFFDESFFCNRSAKRGFYSPDSTTTSLNKKVLCFDTGFALFYFLEGRHCVVRIWESYESFY